MLAGNPLLEPECGRRSNCAAPGRVVIDTNVWLDLFVFRDPGVGELGQALRAGSLLAVRSQRTDAELLEVLTRPQFKQRLAAAGSPALLHRWRTLAHCVEERVSAPWTCSDPEDQKFLDLACSAAAQALFTKDHALLRLARAARRAGLQIIKPGACLSWHACGAPQGG